MQVSRTRKFIANLGNYGERYEASVTTTFSHHDLGYTDEEWLEHIDDVGTQDAFDELTDAVMDALTPELEGELEEANELRDPDEDSFLLRVFPPESKPKKRSRRS